MSLLSETGAHSEEALPVDGNGVRVIVEFKLLPLAAMSPASRASFAHGQFFARFRDDLAQIDGERGKLNGRRAPTQIDHEFSRAFSGVSLSIPPESMAALRALGYVRAVHPDLKVRALVEPGVAAVRAPEVWSGLGARGNGITVAVIDSGIDYSHSAFGGGFGNGFKVVGGHDFVNDDDDPMDDNGHGTHVAGTIAANSSELLGVAPEASLLGFKVLDDLGRGNTSDILAAIERTVDPNGDGDFADRVDVVNMSLGGPGGPEDVLSRAVDTAVGAGVVFCVAAGNAGDVLSIGSPGTAEKAITVGATAGEKGIATFSSRGPNALDYSVKPDIVAPGEGVRSALIGGGLTLANGTSMATPHAAGVAALLRQLHPDWTPQMIKSALVFTATAVGTDVMAAGGGRIDALRAAGATLFSTPSSVSFGRTDGTEAQWTQTRRLVLSNAGSATKSLTVSAPGLPPGVTVAVNPANLTIAPSESRELEVVLTLDNASVAHTSKFSRGGYLEVSGDGDVQRIPWGFAKGIRVRVAYDSETFPVALLTGASAGRLQIPNVGDNLLETLALPGSYDVTLVGVPLGTDGDLRLVASENQAITADRTYHLDDTIAPNRISLLGADEHGVPMYPYQLNGSLCVSMRTLLIPPGAGIPGVTVVLPWNTPLVRASTMSERFVVVAADACGDSRFSRFYLLPYLSARGVPGDLERRAGGAGLHAQPFSLSLPLTDEPQRTITFLASTKVKGELNRGQWFDPFGFGVLWTPDVWNGVLFVQDIVDEEASTLAYLIAEAPASARFPRTAATFHLVDGRPAFFPSETPAPSTQFWSVGEVSLIGGGPLVPRPYFYNFTSAFIYMQATYVGPLGEVRRPGAVSRISLFDEAGAPIATGADDLTVSDYSRRLTLRTSNAGSYRIEGAPGTVSVSARFGGNTALGDDNSPPTLTSLRVADARDRPADRLDQGSVARLRASAIDYKYAMMIARPKPESLAVAYRRSGSQQWIPLQIVLRGEDYGIEREIGHAPDGTIFEADLREVTSSAVGFYDLKVVMEDESGNSNESILEPALFVGPTRHRPTRR